MMNDQLLQTLIYNRNMKQRLIFHSYQSISILTLKKQTILLSIINLIHSIAIHKKKHREKKSYCFTMTSNFLLILEYLMR
jgi:hypothetical protein